MNQRCILEYCYLTINARTIISIRSKNKLELFIVNWSYSYNLKRAFATYQRMRANRTSWARTRHFLFSHNSSDSCASAPFHQLPSASASQSWYVRHVRYLALEVVKGKNPDSSDVVDYNPFTTILHNLNLTLPTGSRCLLIRANGSGKAMLLRILGWRHLTLPYSDVQRR